MKKSRVFIAFLAVIVMVSSLPISAVNLVEKDNVSTTSIKESTLPETLSYETALSRGHISRQYSEEKELNTAVFSNADGTNTLYMFDENIKYVDSNGVVRDKSNKLSKVDDGYTNLSNDITVLYPNDISKGVTLSYGSYKIIMTPIMGLTTFKEPKLESCDKHTIPDKVEYDGVFGNDTKLVYTQNMSGVKEEIILEKDTGKRKFSFTIDTIGLNLVSDKNTIKLVDSQSKKEVANLGNLIMWDSNENYVLGSYLIEQDISGKNIITIDASALLDRKDIKYPVVIDPNINLGGSSTTFIEDATIFTTYATNFGSWHTLFVGNYNAWYPTSSSPRGKARTLVKFPTILQNGVFNALYNDDLINSIKYNFADVDCNGGPITINAYVMNSIWNETSVVYSDELWNAYGVYVGKTEVEPIEPTPSPYPRYEIDITTAVMMWKKGTSNNGIMLMAEDEDDVAAVLGAKDSGNGSTPGLTSSRPYVVINYNSVMSNVVYKIKNVASEKYINVHNGYNADGTNVYQYTDSDDQFAQEFMLEYDSSESAYRIRAMCSLAGRGRVLDVETSGTGVAGLTSGCNIQTNKPNDDIAQLFVLQSLGNGQYKIVLKNNTSLAITANSGDGSAEGEYSNSTGNIYVSTSTSSTVPNNQRWVLERSDTTEEKLYYSLMDIAYPFNPPTQTYISSDFGYRNFGDNPGHTGIDIPAGQGVDLYSAFDGEVIISTTEIITTSDGKIKGRGNYIVVEATNDYNNIYKSTGKLRYVYMHMNNKSNYKVTDIVLKGTVVPCFA